MSGSPQTLTRTCRDLCVSTLKLEKLWPLPPRLAGKGTLPPLAQGKEGREGRGGEEGGGKRKAGREEVDRWGGGRGDGRGEEGTQKAQTYSLSANHRTHCFFFFLFFPHISFHDAN